jgi:pyruvate/2-oxoglutarate dehydrogenase complex dihydrolipoamide dehydrogenase (E3) component
MLNRIPSAAGPRRSGHPKERRGVVILGGGSTGEAFAAALRRLDQDVPITLVEQELVGGECSYWACMPSKALLRPTEILAAARIAPGAAEAITGHVDAERVFWWRDQVTSELSDVDQAHWLAGIGVELVRGRGRVVRAGVVRVGTRELEYDDLVVATGSSAAVPPIRGLAGTDYWTNREATLVREIPESLVVLGGGVVGSELGQFFSRMGSRTTIVEVQDRLLPREHEGAGRLLRRIFEEEGIDVRVGAQVEEVERTPSSFRLHLAGGATVDGERLLVAAGRRPNVEGLGLEQPGVEIAEQGIRVDDRLQAAEGVWAIGDVTGVALLTHVGKYQARVAAANVAGGEARADYRAIPAVVFTDPQVATVGTTQGTDLVSATWKVSATGRASTYERPKRPGFLTVFADPERGVLAGAVAVGPEAGEWIGQLTLAVKAELPVEVLRDTVQPYPTFSEAVFFAVRDLPLGQYDALPASASPARAVA